jgi:hypothetical protein
LVVEERVRLVEGVVAVITAFCNELETRAAARNAAD